MPTGDVTFTNYGAYGISGQELTDVVDNINLGTGFLSGQQLHLIPAGEGQVMVYKTVPLTW